MSPALTRGEGGGEIRASVRAALCKAGHQKIDKHALVVSRMIGWSKRIHVLHQLPPWRYYIGGKMAACAHSLWATCSTIEHLVHHSSESFLKKGVCVHAHACARVCVHMWVEVKRHSNLFQGRLHPRGATSHKTQDFHIVTENLTAYWSKGMFCLFLL